MATVKYLTKGKSNPQTIYVRLRDGRNADLTLSTGLTISPDHWSTAKGWVSTKANHSGKLNLDRELRQLETLIHEERNAQVRKGLPINKDWLEGIILQWQGKAKDGVSDHLTDLIDQYRDSLTERVRNGKKGVHPGTLRNYNTTKQRIEKYEAKTREPLRISSIDLGFHKRYIKFASETLGLATNSIGKDIRNIKTVCLHAKDMGLTVNDHVLSRNFSAPSEKTHFTTLNTVEIEQIRNFHGANYLENARDWLIIGCWTGCRVGDLMQLTKNNIVYHKSGTRIIQYTQSKTGKMVNVPMHPHVEEITTRLNGFPRPISSVKFNEYIKEVCRLAGLTQIEFGTRQNPNTHLKESGEFEKWQLVKSHICRRSFATNHYNKLTNKMIMAVTGHATEKMLLNYIGETESEHIEDFLNLWNTPESKALNPKPNKQPA